MIDDGDHKITNRSGNRTFAEVADARLARRRLLKGGMIGAAAFIARPTLAALLAFPVVPPGASAPLLAPALFSLPTTACVVGASFSALSTPSVFSDLLSTLYS